MKNTLPVIMSLTLFSGSAFALVDYSEPTSRKAVSRPAPIRQSAPAKSVSRAPSRSSRSQSYSPSGMFSLGLGMESLSVEQASGEGKVTFANFNGRFDTGYNVFLDVDYYTAKSSSEALASESFSYQKGNPKAVLGFNWLTFGDRMDRTTVDLYAGASFGTKDSDFATERTDKIFGMETTKMMGMMGLGFGYELTVTGSSDQELSIGNIHRVHGALGIVVSGDIQLQIEAAYVRISAGNETEPRFLEEQVSYGEIVPKLQLGLTPMVQFELGGTFRTKRQQDAPSLLGANLWREKGLYGNSIHAGLNINL